MNEWLRLHTPPNVGRLRRDLWFRSDLSAKEKWYYDRSKARYDLTEDGLHLKELGRNLSGELGRIENVRFISCKPLDI